MKSHRVLSGTIQGVERPENIPSRSMAVLYHGDFKVIIPAEEMVDPPEDLHGYPGICIFIAAAGFNLFGEALRDILQPQEDVL